MEILGATLSYYPNDLLVGTVNTPGRSYWSSGVVTTFSQRLSQAFIARWIAAPLSSDTL